MKLPYLSTNKAEGKKCKNIRANDQHKRKDTMFSRFHELIKQPRIFPFSFLLTEVCKGKVGGHSPAGLQRSVTNGQSCFSWQNGASAVDEWVRQEMGIWHSAIAEATRPTSLQRLLGHINNEAASPCRLWLVGWCCSSLAPPRQAGGLQSEWISLLCTLLWKTTSFYSNTISGAFRSWRRCSRTHSAGTTVHRVAVSVLQV